MVSNMLTYSKCQIHSRHQPCFSTFVGEVTSLNTESCIFAKLASITQYIVAWCASVTTRRLQLTAYALYMPLSCALQQSDHRLLGGCTTRCTSCNWGLPNTRTVHTGGPQHIRGMVAVCVQSPSCLLGVLGACMHGGRGGGVARRGRGETTQGQCQHRLSTRALCMIRGGRMQAHVCSGHHPSLVCVMCGGAWAGGWW